MIWAIKVWLMVWAKSIVIILITERWLPCVPYMQIFCLTYALRPVHTANLNAIKAIGRSDIFLKLEFIKKIIGLISILITMPFGVFYIALGTLVTSPMNILVNAYPNSVLLNYTYKE